MCLIPRRPPRSLLSLLSLQPTATSSRSRVCVGGEGGACVDVAREPFSFVDRSTLFSLARFRRTALPVKTTESLDSPHRGACCLPHGVCPTTWQGHLHAHGECLACPPHHRRRDRFSPYLIVQCKTHATMHSLIHLPLVLFLSAPQLTHTQTQTFSVRTQSCGDTPSALADPRARTRTGKHELPAGCV